MNDPLQLYNLTVEHQSTPLGLDCSSPRFGWKLGSTLGNVSQTAYQIEIYENGSLAANTGRVSREDSVENSIPNWSPAPMTRYNVHLTVWDNQGRFAQGETWFETGRMGVSFSASWAEPIQEPTPSSLRGKDFSVVQVADNPLAGKKRDYAEFRPAQYVRIPFKMKKGVQSARVYATAHGLYRLTVNGQQADKREFAPEHTSYHKVLLYQTYDITPLLREGENVLGVILGDGWWAGRVGTTGDSCQYGDKLALLLECRIQYQDGSKQLVTGEDGFSHSGPIVFSDLFVGEKSLKQISDTPP